MLIQKIVRDIRCMMDIHGERGHITDMFNETFPNLSATVAGETGIDIYPKDSGKETGLDRLR